MLGLFISTGSIEVEGRVDTYAPDQTTLTLDGTAIPFATDGAFSRTLEPEPGRPFHSFGLALWRNGNPDPLERRRVTTVLGEGRDASERVPTGISLRLSDLALDAIAADFAEAIASEVDVEAIVRESNPVAKESSCLTDTPLGCAAKVEVEADVERVDIGKVKVHADSRNEKLWIEVVLKNLEVDYDIDGDLDCNGRIRVDKASIPAKYRVAPDALKPWRLDVNLIRSSLDASLHGFDNDFTSGICDVPVIDDLVEQVIGNLDDLLRDALLDVFDDPDGDGRKDSPVAEGVEDAIDYRTLWAPLGDALEVAIDTTLGAAAADPQGLTIDFDPLVSRQTESCGAGPELDAALDVPSTPIAWGDLTPGGQPYDLAVALSASALNQMLRARVACGWLRADIDELDLGGGPLPLDAGLLGLLVPGLSSLDPDTPISLEIEPSLAPLVTGDAGPAGEPLDLWLAHWRVTLRDGSTGAALIELVLELRTGLDLSLAADGAHLEFGLGAVPAEAVRSFVVGNALEVDDGEVSAAVSALVPTLLSAFGLDLDPVPVPGVAGLALAGVELAPVGDKVVAFMALAP